MHDQINAAAQSFWPRLAQGSCRQQPVIAHAAIVKHRHFNVTRQSIVLQSVITEQHLGSWIGLEQSFGSIDPSCRHKNSRVGQLFDQRGFIARLGHRCVWSYFLAGFAAPAIAARHNAHFYAARLQMVGKCYHQRRFPRATGHHIAHDKHRRGHARGLEDTVAVQCAADIYQQTVEQGRWPQQASQPATS